MPELISATEDAAQVLDRLLEDVVDLRETVLMALDVLDHHACDRLDDTLDAALNVAEGVTRDLRRAAVHLRVATRNCPHQASDG